MYHTFPINNSLKQGDALRSLLLKFALEFVIRDDQVNQEGLKLKSEHQLLVYADDVNILGDNTHTVRKNKQALAVQNTRPAHRLQSAAHHTTELNNLSTRDFILF